MLLTAIVPALASTIIVSPVNGSQVPNPFNLTMSADTCSSRPVTYVGYSLDSSTSTPVFAGQRMNGPVNSPIGWHTLHVKVWNDWGAICVTDVSFDVAGGATSIIPANAVKVSSIQSLGNWIKVHDGGTPGTSSGWTGTQSAPSMTGVAREFASAFNYYGGQRYSVQFDDDTTSTNFFYDTWFYIAGNADGFSNLEFDLNQTMSNGETVVMGFQCDSWVGRWDIARNTVSPTAFNDTWAHSNVPCKVHTWGTNQWHHLQMWHSHDYSGWVTYHAVWLDGVRHDINATVFSGYELGWAPAIVTNFQIDGASSGSSSGIVYLDALAVYRW